MTRKLTLADITVRRTASGYWECSAIVDGYMVDRKYLYYTKREATRLFRDGVNAGEIR